MPVDGPTQIYALPELLASWGELTAPTSITVHVCSSLTSMLAPVLASSQTSSKSITVVSFACPSSILFMRPVVGQRRFQQ